MARITGFETLDVRFPTSRTLAGSDAMNQAPDYSAAYVIIRTDVQDLSGHGFAFTIGRGNDLQLAAIRLLEPFLAGQDLDEVLADLGGLGRRLVSDSPLHWLGPSCGVVHMATGAVLNACWDLAARRAGKPLWLLLAELPPEEITRLVESVRPVKMATGEHVANPVMFKQLLQADAIDIMQIDACRVAGVNENIANLLAAKFGVPVCPHAGGVGLCEIVQHLSMFDYVALSGTTQGRMIEWIDHLHEHFAAPAVVARGRYRAPERPGASTEILPESLAEYSYPDGPAWRPPRGPGWRPRRARRAGVLRLGSAADVTESD
jgi:L-alanine-DL-glutamate epimerase-like enolase superfamily enzyme